MVRAKTDAAPVRALGRSLADVGDLLPAAWRLVAAWRKGGVAGLMRVAILTNLVKKDRASRFDKYR